MDQGLDPLELPKLPARTTAHGRLAKEKKKFMTEIAAACWVAMENGDYVYPPGVLRQYDENGNITPNKSEAMRKAGYRGKSVEKFNTHLGEDQYFWDMVELFRIRRTDPMFRRGEEHKLWGELGNEALRELTLRLRYMPNQQSTSELLNVVKTVLNAGVQMQRIGTEDTRADDLLEQLPPELRAKALEGYKDSLEAELERVESLEGAHRAADQE